MTEFIKTVAIGALGFCTGLAFVFIQFTWKQTDVKLYKVLLVIAVVVVLLFGAWAIGEDIRILTRATSDAAGAA